MKLEASRVVVACSLLLVGSVFLLLGQSSSSSSSSQLRNEESQSSEESSLLRPQQRDLRKQFDILAQQEEEEGFDDDEMPLVESNATQAANGTGISLLNATTGDDNDDMLELEDGGILLAQVEDPDAMEELNRTAEPVTSEPTAPPPTLEPTEAPSQEPTSAPTMDPFGPIDYVGNDAGGFYAPYPLGVCQGDCDSDSDCAEGLYCHQRPAYGAVPGCTGGESYSSTADFCAWDGTSDPPNLPEKYDFGAMEYVGNDGTWYAVYPLNVCKGDCDTDADCADGLYCFNRNPNTAIPGCSGGEEDATTADICVWNTSLPLPEPDPTPPLEAFRLKLYWQEGYEWQNETFEREWCMSHDFNGYPGTGGCWYEDDFKNCSANQLHMALCIDADPRQWFTFKELGDDYNRDNVDEVLIQTMGGNGNRCFERRSSQIYLERCNPEKQTQRFYAINGAFTGYRFELGQYRGYTRENCVTNAHHPKSGEIVEFHICEEARKEHDETSFWEYF